MPKAFSAFFVVAALLPGLAGAAENSDNSGEASPAGVEVTTSFIGSCRNTKVYYGHDGAVIEANADSCRKRDGSWGGYTSFSGYCTGDVSNNDGNIFCRN